MHYTFHSVNGQFTEVLLYSNTPTVKSVHAVSLGLEMKTPSWATVKLLFVKSSFAYNTTLLTTLVLNSQLLFMFY